jgi:STIP1 family protein 1
LNSIISEPKNAALYTNRAMTRLKLGYWDSVISDCNACIALAPSSMKAHFYLAQAQSSLGDPDTALSSALRAYELCRDTGDKSLPTVAGVVLRCKKDRWDARERRRAREARDLEEEVVRMLGAERDALLAEEADGTERRAIEEESDGKVARLREVFERARKQDDRRREVPDWAIDDISFGIMVDPVITKMGKSYERASLMEHLRRHPSDPLTREPLTAAELRPNLGLRQACDEFLENNGWAVDW